MAQKNKGKQTATKGRKQVGGRKTNSTYQAQISGMAATAGNAMVMSAFRRTPRVVQNGSSLRVCNTERVLAALSFSDNVVVTTRSAFNPCNTSVFGWLPQVARNYSQYVVHGLKFSWVPRASTSVTSEIQMGVFYDFGDASYYVSSLSGATQMDNLGEFAYGTAWQGGPLATHDSKLLNVPTGWFGVIADTDKMHARVQRFTCNNTGGGTTPGENQVCAAHLVTRTFQPAGSPTPAGSVYVSYDIEFFHPTIAAANAAPFTLTDEDPSKDRTCWRENPTTGEWEKVSCGKPPPPPPAPKPVDEVSREAQA